MSIEWFETCNLIKKCVFRIKTIVGEGTGFILSLGKDRQTGIISGMMIATAAHVINKIGDNDAIEITNESQNLQFNRENCHIDISQLGGDEYDMGMLAITDINFIFTSIEDVPLSINQNIVLMQGHEIGWMGYPILTDGELCFFHGYISAFINKPPVYIVDGVSINGVSGGPVFTKDGNIIGIVSSYTPNTQFQKTLPGFSSVVPINDIKIWMSKKFKVITV